MDELKVYQFDNQVVVLTKSLEVKKVRLLSPSPSLTNLTCGLCLRRIGSARPIALVWTKNGSPRRLCNSCSQGLKETK
jgi:hypothetical protein